MCSPVIAFACFALSGCSELRISTAYYVEVGGQPQPANRVFRAGEAYRLALNNGVPGCAYLLRREPDGSYQVLFPSSSIGGGSAWLGRNATVILPADGTFRFPEIGGEVELLLLVSTYRSDDLSILEMKSQIDASVMDDMVGAFERHPATVRWPAAEPSEVRVHQNAVPAASGEDYRGNLVMIRSPLPEVGVVARFELRCER